VLDDAFRTHGLEFILGVTAPGNGAAIRVFEKLGFQPMGRVTAWGAVLDAYRLERP
jgi:RimJ/RimL family protein N-acetyltransferase